MSVKEVITYLEWYHPKNGAQGSCLACPNHEINSGYTTIDCESAMYIQ